MESTKEHWEKEFATKAEYEVSWFQPYPKTSVEFFEIFNLPKEFETTFELFKCIEEKHVTSINTIQNFLFEVFKESRCIIKNSNPIKLNFK